MVPKDAGYNGQINQKHLDAFAEALYSRRYQGAHGLFVENLHDIAPALYNRFLEHAPRIHLTTGVEPILFQHSVSDFDLADAKRWYATNAEAVGKFLREYFGQIALSMADFGQLAAKFPDLGRLVETITQGKPEDEKRMEVILAFSN